MSKVLDNLRLFDDFVTNKVTKFCWWTDLRFDKDNVWWVKITMLFIFPVLDNLVYFFVDGFKDHSIWRLVGTVTAIIILMLFLNKLSVTKTIVANAKCSPNKNRHHLYAMVSKIASVFYLIPINITESSGCCTGLTTSTNILFSVTMLLVTYLLCSEPVPPAKKREYIESKMSVHDLRPLQIR